jgi:hypothetical protein
MFLPWIEAEFEMSQSAAYRFINVAEQYSGKLLTVGSLSPKALYELAAPSTPPEAREEIERRVAAGEIVSAARSPARWGAFKRGSGLGVRLGGSRGTIMDRRAKARTTELARYPRYPQDGTRSKAGDRRKPAPRRAHRVGTRHAGRAVVLVEPGCDLHHLLHAKRCGKWDGVIIIRRGSIMPTIFDLLYREYCRARLAEMRKQLLLEVPEANCDVSRPGGSAGRDSGLGDDRTATQHEAGHGTPN